MKLRNRLLTSGTDQRLIDGVRADLQEVPAMRLGGREFTPATLEAFLQARLDAYNAIAAAKAAWEQTIDAYGVLDDETSLVVRNLKSFILSYFGEDSPRLADFGFVPPRRFEMSAEQKSAAVAKRAATRAARGTRGRKQKLAITGATEATAAKPEPAKG
ncbi:MAG TPA: hypothetical protein VGG39_12310 [Polyangiaceae bacterium]|jgi:hypothetical protein